MASSQEYLFYALGAFYGEEKRVEKKKKKKLFQ